MVLNPDKSKKNDLEETLLLGKSSSKQDLKKKTKFEELMTASQKKCFYDLPEKNKVK